MPRQLTNLRVTNVDICALGANMDEETGEGSQIVLWKSVDVPRDAVTSANISRSESAGRADHQRTGNMPDETSQVDSDVQDDESTPEPTAKAVKRGRQPDPAAVDDAIQAAVAKARAEADQQIAALKSQIDTATSALAEMRDQQISKLFAEKAAAFVDVGDAQVIAQVLKTAAAREDASEFLPQVEQLFQTAAARISEASKRGGNLFGEQGTTVARKSSGDGYGPAGDELAALVGEIATAKSITREAATVIAIGQRPDLYGAYLDSQRG